ncbi:DUF2960 family protein [Catenovulum maritimum]|uniref:DUF2960 domain-containing protein n=1 Tax=Catenovulum maritimum TaxID=1513271 RepID=A0A0J8JLM0_9ALTE|nr:DUF2960 family protein [Catenovulum maritimum]KMT65461.1 hypothetical protein XM47_08900 [Catenovulum maritimum]
MARRVSYKFKNVAKEINFSYDKHRDIYEAIAAAEKIDLTKFLQMEEQVHMTAKDKSAIKNFRQKEFERMGFSEIVSIKEIKE